ncbi:MAG: translation initiation factor IF-2 [Sphingobacteriaceae bacterium]
MSEGKNINLLKAAKELNIGLSTAAEFLSKKGFAVEAKPMFKLEPAMYDALMKEFQGDKIVKEEAKQIAIGKIRRDDVVEQPAEKPAAPKNADNFESEEILIKNAGTFAPAEKPKPADDKPAAEEVKPETTKGVKVIGKINLDELNTKTRPEKKAEPVVEVKPEPKVEEKPITPPVVPPATPPAAKPADELFRAKATKLSGPNIIGKIELPETRRPSNPVASSSNAAGDQKRKRKRKDFTPGQAGGDTRPGGAGNRPDNRNRPNTAPGVRKEEPSDKEIQDQIKATLARLSGAGKSGKFAQRAKLRRQKRDDVAQSAEEAALERELKSKVLKVTEFVTANELANMMDVQVTQIISTCMSLGMFVSINQRLDAETLTIVADEFGYEVEFVKPEDEENFSLEEEDAPEDLLPRAPIVTVMGHVDHGKTSLLDFVRKTNVIAGEAGGITQHIGAYEVTLENGNKITFLDTPGHEAFTAMRARGAQVTDIAIIVIAADDSVMPQTREAINHAQAAGVPIVFAFSKVDKPGANADKIREQLSTMNILVEDWGGKYQSQEISGKTGMGIDSLLEKVLLEAELLDLKANPNKRAAGTVIEAALDKGRGIVTTVLIQSGTLKVGDPILAGCYSGRVKALTNERGQKVEKAGPSTPVQVLGMQGAPTSGDKFNALESEVEAREIANKRLQLQREQGLRSQKHITLDEIGRRLAIGNFKELNIIVKGDVDGSIEALSDSLLKLSTEEIQVNIIHKSVGQISESDVLLASASDAIIIGFQVRPSQNARKLAEQEQIDIRLYSIIYDAINEVKAAMEGMLAPEFEEKITANVEIREVFKISKVGTIAGCMVLDGKINRNSKVRIIRDGVVIYSGELASLKRFKEDVKEVSTNYECGLNIQNFNNIEVGDIVEAYEQVEVKRKL